MSKGYRRAARKVKRARREGETRLDLSNLRLKRLPPELWEYTSLSRLHLGENQLASLPKGIGNLTALTWLNLSSNNLTKLPESIGNLTALTELLLGRNKLAALPESIGNLNSLTTLRFELNQLTGLPETIGNLSALTFLDLGDNQLATLPEAIGNLSALTHLSVSGNQLSELDHVAALPRLIELQATDNPLGEPVRQIAEAGNEVLALFLKAQNWQESGSRILRSIEFPPEYKSAGVAILSHFSEVLRSKYKGIKTGVTITQEGNLVTMIVETPEGHVEEITKALNEYGLVVRGEMAPEEFLEDPVEIAELRAQIRQAQTMVEIKKDLLQIQGTQIEKLHQHIDLLIRNQPKLLESQPAPVIQVIQQNASIDPSQLVTELSQLRAELQTAASNPEQFTSLAEVSKAEEAARSGDGSKAAAHLKRAGKWALDVAETLALEAAKAAVRGQFG